LSAVATALVTRYDVPYDVPPTVLFEGSVVLEPVTPDNKRFELDVIEIERNRLSMPGQTWKTMGVAITTLYMA
jgi:hypothetical protein